MTRCLLGAAAVILILGFHRFADDRIGAFGRSLLIRYRPPRRHSLEDAAGVVRLGAAGLTQMLLCLFLVWLTGASRLDLGLGAVHPIRLLQGVALGVGELALGSFLGHTAVRASSLLLPAGAPAAMADWLTVARGGWMRCYLKTVEIAPLPVALGLIVLYVGGEEILFRGVVFTAFLPLGKPMAVAISTAAFAAAQIFQMPSWRAAMFPFIGAVMMGVLHGALFSATGDVTPLIVAHFVFFISAVL